MDRAGTVPSVSTPVTAGAVPVVASLDAARGAPRRRHPGPPMSDYVFTMVRASKFYGPERKVLDDITLAFLPGAKIGVLGPNGAGKSTLLRIMAGVEEPSSRPAGLTAGGGPPGRPRGAPRPPRQKEG